MSTSGPTPGGQAPSGRAGKGGLPAGRRERLKLGAAGAVAALVLIFGLVNTDQVKVDWIVATTHNALIVVIVVSFVLGGLTGWGVARRRSRG